MDNISGNLYFKTADSDLELQECYRLRYQVYCEEKRWISSDEFPNGLEIDNYDKRAIHVMALNEDFKLVGLMRILQKKDFRELPAEHHPGLAGRAIYAPDVAELSRFVVTANKDRMAVTRGLLRAVYQVSKELGIQNWCTVVEPSLIRLLGILDFKLEPSCQPVSYFGGFTLVAIGNIEQIEKSWLDKKAEVKEFFSSNGLYREEVAIAI